MEHDGAEACADDLGQCEHLLPEKDFLVGFLTHSCYLFLGLFYCFIVLKTGWGEPDAFNSILTPFPAAKLSGTGSQGRLFVFFGRTL